MTPTLKMLRWRQYVPALLHMLAVVDPSNACTASRQRFSKAGYTTTPNNFAPAGKQTEENLQQIWRWVKLRSLVVSLEQDFLVEKLLLGFFCELLDASESSLRTTMQHRNLRLCHPFFLVDKLE